MNVSTIHKNAMGEVLQAISGASGVRIADDKGNYVDVIYNTDSKCWEVRTSFKNHNFDVMEIWAP